MMTQATTASRGRRFRKWATFVALLAVLNVFAALVLDVLADSDSELSLRDRIVSIEPATVDFGTVEPGALCERPVRITNNSVLPLRIQEIVTTCGCAVAERPEAPLASGESIDIAVRFRAPRRHGREVEKAITLVFDRKIDPLEVPVRARTHRDQ